MALVSKNFSDIITFTRASTATYFDASGTLQSAATDAPRFDYNPSTLAAQGLLIEESRTNSIRNNTMVGAAAGTPGTAPTNWTSPGASSGMTTTVVGTGTESGITYIDIQIQGTFSGVTGTWSAINFETSTGIAALVSQTWTESAYLRLAAGSLINVTLNFRQSERNSAGTALLTVDGPSLTITSGALNANRFSYTRTTTEALTAYILPQIRISLVNGAVYDFTLRVGLPQLEQGAFATSVIPTTTTALTRAADVASVNTLSPWYNAAEGTIYIESTRSTTTGYPGRIRFSDGTANNAIDLYYDAASNSSTYEIRTGGITQAAIYGGGGTLNAVTKAAAAYKVNDAVVYYGGSLQGTDTSLTVPSGINQVRIGNALTGYILRITYYPTRLSNAQLQAITA